MRKWKCATAGMAAACLILATVLVVRASDDLKPELIRITADAASDEDDWEQVALSQMPPHVWSTGIVFNGNTGGSAVIISPTGEGLSCGHCFNGVKGGHFVIRRPDGTDVEAELLEHIPHRGWGNSELCLFRIDPENVIDWAPICLDDQPDAEIDVIGYPQLHGPVYLPLADVRDSGQEMRVYHVTNGGRIISGNSGSPIFRNGRLDAIVAGANNEQVEFEIADFEMVGAKAQQRRQERRESRQERGQGGRGGHGLTVGVNAIATKRETLIQFVKHNSKRFRNGNQPFCDKNGNCYDANGNPIQKQPEAQAAQPKKPAEMQPNLPMPAKPYDGKGRPPEDIRGNKNQAKEIDKLRRQPPGNGSANPNQPQPFTPQNNPGETAPDTAAPAPSPPALSSVDAGLHGKVDSILQIGNTLKQTLADVKAAQDQTGIIKKLEGVKQVQQDVQTLKDELAKLHAGQQTLADGQLGPADLQQIFVGALSGPLGQEAKKLHDKLDAAHAKLDGLPVPPTIKDVSDAAAAGVESHLPGFATKIVAGVGALIPGVNVPIVGGLIGGSALLGLAHWLVSRRSKGVDGKTLTDALKSQAETIGGALDGHSVTIAGQTNVLSTLVEHILNHTSAPGAPPAMLDSGQSPAQPAAPLDGTLQKILSALEGLKSQFLPSLAPAPVGATPAQPVHRGRRCLTEIEDPDETITPGGQSLNQIIKVPSEPTVLQPGSIDRGAMAWQSTMQMLAQKYPHLAINGTIKRVDALWRQAYSGTSC